jgi:hypothetical protein
VSAVVFGGYGVFGARVCRELARLGTKVAVAGRHGAQAEALARELGSGHSGLVADAEDAVSCRAALAGHAVAVDCAGPFSHRTPALLEACLEAGCHYVDIADDRGYVATVRGYGERFRERGATAVFGASSLPGLSGALALLARGSKAEPPEQARITLFIGNDNPKSEAAIRSVVVGLGRAIPAPQGTLRGFRERARVELPPPFGWRTVYALASPDYDVLPEALGVGSLSVFVGFERAAAGAAFSLLARCGPLWGPRMARIVTALGSLSRGGSSGGVVLAELVWRDGSTRRAALSGVSEGQRFAALPAALVARALETGAATAPGVHAAYELLGAESLVAQVEAAGFRLLRE